jgi:hypothetical protein
MIVDEIIATCSHPKIAGAALQSIGGAFVEEIVHDARAIDLAPEAFVALVVSRRLVILQFIDLPPARALPRVRDDRICKPVLPSRVSNSADAGLRPMTSA